jgi:hypothetical protein
MQCRHPCASAIALIAGGASLFGEPRGMTDSVRSPSFEARNERAPQDDVERVVAYARTAVSPGIAAKPALLA